MTLKSANAETFVSASFCTGSFKINVKRETEVGSLNEDAVSLCEGIFRFMSDSDDELLMNLR